MEYQTRAAPQDLLTPHRPNQLRDTQGRVLHLSWDAHAHLQEISLQPSPDAQPRLLMRAAIKIKTWSNPPTPQATAATTAGKTMC